MRLSTTTVGTGPLRLGLVHGLGGSGELWEPVGAHLVRTGRYTVTAVDLRGHGNSGRMSSYSLDEFADDLVHSLPTGLDAVVGHSLGGTILARAVERLRPARAIYLDPGFGLALPTTGLASRLFWAIPALSLGIIGVGRARGDARIRATYSPEIRASLHRARTRFDAAMAPGVFKEVAYSPLPVAPPVVASTIVLSDASRAVVPEQLAAQLAACRWRIERLPGVDHDMHLQAPHRTSGIITGAL